MAPISIRHWPIVYRTSPALPTAQVADRPGEVNTHTPSPIRVTTMPRIIKPEIRLFSLLWMVELRG